MGEFDLVRGLQRLLGPAGGEVLVGVGDDAAVIAPDLIITTDLVIEDVHFRRATSTLQDVGWKALAVSLSDIAAMAATPLAAVIAVGLAAGSVDADLAALYEGVTACASAYNCPVVGGDLSRAEKLVVASTVTGRTRRPVLRRGALVGDVVAVSGPVGGSEAGRLMAEGTVPAGEHAAALVARHRRPRPALETAAALAGIAHAMLDLSDGVAADAARMAEASGVRIVIDLDALPVAAGVAGAAGSRGVSPAVFAATGGEDYELLVALPAPDAARLRLAVIGRVEPGVAGAVFESAGAEVTLRGWDHFVA